MENTIYSFQAKDIDGQSIKLEQFKEKVILIVNVASKCGFTSQYEGLEKIYKEYKDKGLIILGFPCNQFGAQESGSEKEIKEFCSLTYDVTFPMFSKINVNGSDTHPLYEFLKEQMKNDRAKYNILPPSKFGVVEITRQRVRPVTDIKTAEKCPVCDGTGEVQATILLADEIESSLKFVIENNKEKKITLTVHPFLEAYFKKGIFSKRWKWLSEYKKWIKVHGNHSFHFNIG